MKCIRFLGMAGFLLLFDPSLVTPAQGFGPVERPATYTVYDNFGPGYGGWDYNWGFGWTVAGDDNAVQDGYEQAMLFDCAANGILTDVWVPLWYVPSDPQPDAVTVRLTSNPDGLPPVLADVLEEWVITDLPDWYDWSPPHHLVGNGATRLEAGESYWLWALGSSTTLAGWPMNVDPAFLCPHTLKKEGEGWVQIYNETASAFRVDVRPTPGRRYCFGVQCPCGNDSPRAGCRNSTGSGAALGGWGSVGVAADDLVLTATSVPANQLGAARGLGADERALRERRALRYQLRSLRPAAEQRQRGADLGSGPRSEPRHGCG